MINWIKELFNRDPPEDRQPTSAMSKAKTLVWGVNDGPYLAEDIVPDEYLDEQYEGAAMLVCMVEEGGKILKGEVWFSSMTEAYDVVKHFNKSIEPLEVEV